uniref:Myozenin 3a n=1 Tax=Tetraodon nigroviridis TaxID=99883 RepID=H3C6B0_TETNG
MMYSGLDDATKQRMMQAQALSMEAKGVGLNLGKKMSVPKDIMMEELNLSSNRGSRMFQERQKRAERFTLENAVNGIDNTCSVLTQIVPPPQNFQPVKGGKENQVLIIPGKHNLVKGLQKSVAMKGRPDVLAPGEAPTLNRPSSVNPHGPSEFYYLWQQYERFQQSSYQQPSSESLCGYQQRRSEARQAARGPSR